MSALNAGPSKPTRPTRAQTMEMTRQRLLVAARALIAEHGYTAATINAVAERADVTHGGVHTHFPEKLLLGIAVLTEWVGEVADHVDQYAQIYSWNELGDPANALARVLSDLRWVRLHMELTAESRCEPVVHDSIALLRTKLAQAITATRGPRSSEPDTEPDEPEALAAMILTYLYGSVSIGAWNPEASTDTLIATISLILKQHSSSRLPQSLG
ncbi:TetR/AcrR family transcriptional regulator (plasmid) [Nocardia sp. CA-084685]|uniref:TetR/AcrR family transcriptional regulator n=1 Tax=Nocardia sp. CA-084685 TaxID=3239970 RepID=UPI003D97825F